MPIRHFIEVQGFRLGDFSVTISLPVDVAVLTNGSRVETVHSPRPDILRLKTLTVNGEVGQTVQELARVVLLRHLYDSEARLHIAIFHCADALLY